MFEGKVPLPTVKEMTNLEENALFDLYLAVTAKVTQKLLSTLYIMCTIHRQSLKLLRLMI